MEGSKNRATTDVDESFESRLELRRLLARSGAAGENSFPKGRISADPEA